MRKKFCLALLLITAICLSAGAAQADSEWLKGTWRMGNGEGEGFVIKVGSGDPETGKSVDAAGSGRFAIRNVDFDGEAGTLDALSIGSYTLSATINDEPESLPMIWREPAPELAFTFNESEDSYEMTIPIGTQSIGLEMTRIDDNTAEIVLSFTAFVIGAIEGEDVVVTGDLEFTAKKDPPRNSSSGGCDTGAGLGLFLALGALAAFKRAKRKA